MDVPEGGGIRQVGGLPSATSKIEALEIEGGTSSPHHSRSGEAFIAASKGRLARIGAAVPLDSGSLTVSETLRLVRKPAAEGRALRQDESDLRRVQAASRHADEAAREEGGGGGESSSSDYGGSSDGDDGGGSGSNDSEDGGNTGWAAQVGEGGSKALRVQDPPGGKQVGDRIFRSVALRLLPITFLIALACQLDRSNLALAQLQMSEDLVWLTKTVYGLGAGVLFLGYAAGQLPSNLCCIALGAPRWLSIIVSLWGGVAASFAALYTKTQFYILRLLLGLTESGAYPAMYLHLGHFFDDKELGVGYTITASATALAGLVGGPIAAACLCLDGFLGMEGWRWLFLLEGLPTVALGLAIPFILLKSISACRFLPVDDRCWMLQRQQAALQRKLQLSAGADKAITALTSWRVWWLGVCWFLMAASMDGLVSWIPQLIQASLQGGGMGGSSSGGQIERPGSRCGLFSSGVGAAKVAALSATPYTVAAVLMICVSISSKRAGERHLHAGLPIAVASITLGLLPTLVAALGFWGGYLPLIVATAGVWGAHGPLLSWPSSFLHGSAAATGFALIKTIGAIGSFLGSFLIGLVTDAAGGDFSAAVNMLSGFLVVCAASLLLFPDPVQRQGAHTRGSCCPWWLRSLLAAARRQGGGGRRSRRGGGGRGGKKGMESAAAAAAGGSGSGGWWRGWFTRRRRMRLGRRASGAGRSKAERGDGGISNSPLSAASVKLATKGSGPSPAHGNVSSDPEPSGSAAEPEGRGGRSEFPRLPNLGLPSARLRRPGSSQHLRTVWLQDSGDAPGGDDGGERGGSARDDDRIGVVVPQVKL